MEISHIHLYKGLTSVEVQESLDGMIRDPHLVLVFASPSRLKASSEIQAIRRAFPDSSLVGCTTAGEIYGNGVFEDSISVTALRFEQVKVRVVSICMDTMADSGRVGVFLGERLQKEELDEGLAGVLMLAPGILVNGSALVQGVASKLKDGVMLVGSMAGDGIHYFRTCTLDGEHWSDRQVVAVGFYGERFRLSAGSCGGWSPFGPVRRVTLAKDNLLYELDGKPALEVYRRYLADYSDNLPYFGQMYPFFIQKAAMEGKGAIRAITGVNEQDGSLIMAGDVPQGVYVRLTHAETSNLLESAATAAAHLAERQTGTENEKKLAFLFSNVGRKLVMGGRADEDVEVVARCLGEGVMLIGFYGYGEIGPGEDGVGSCLYNQTMTVALLWEAV